MKETIKKLLSEKRFVHCCGVAELSKDLAKNLGVDPQKAYLAGLVHDIAKEKNLDEMIYLCDKFGVETDSLERTCTALMHAPAGAAILPQYGITDSDIINAVRYHTVGRYGMSPLEKIIYLADMAEPSRVYDGAETLRRLLKADFEAAFAEALRRSVVWNMEKGNAVHPGSLSAWNELIENGFNSNKLNKMIGGEEIDFRG